MKPNWSEVGLADIFRACKQFDAGKVAPRRKVHSLLVVVKGKTYPAKFIRRQAYFLATGINLDKSQNHTRNDLTVEFFEALGLETRQVLAQLIRLPSRFSAPKLTRQRRRA